MPRRGRWSPARENGVVPKASNELGSPGLDTGWAELKEGRWDAAMAFFEEAVAAQESPEAVEGLSWAAWWRDDSRGPRWWLAHRCRRACAASTRRLRRPWRVRPTIPISSAWACCFLVTACSAVRDYERAFEWCDRIAEFAERYGSRYMLAFCRGRVRRGAPLAGQVGGRGDDACGFGRRLLPLTARDGGRPAGRARGAETEAGPRRRKRRCCSIERGPSSAAQLCRARLALDQRQTLRAVELVERLLRQLPDAAQAGPRPGARAAHPRPDRARASWTRPRSALEALREIERLVGTVPLRACRGRGRGIARRGGRRPRTGEDAAGGRRRSLRAKRRAVRGGPGEDRARHQPGRAGAYAMRLNVRRPQP